ncbi:DNA polymerase delta subunit [Grosmannia clavigera kw1407]|uniref:DNA polymerase delta subunit n=1 Tax=Grosmannia clavigera (strain kw1407 / UAMH 11150) TaxID=655863 RepID=F0X7L1_GROCL|nr:DNA polymerase delta subunit [Grosmannia clavigera kw1407]EFX06257.1 DNA polymerase delta subunit [Grosmannia clavigera kw1407]
MPPIARKASGNRQATLSFNHRVTKASVPKVSAKESVLAATKKAEKAETKREPTRRTATPESEAADSESGEKIHYVEPVTPAAAAKSEAEIKAESEAAAVGDVQMRRYWQSIEAQRMASRVHQENLDLGEKVLRYFDVSSQFGPCVGISRKKRWMRAQRLGLAPPIEVLAVLLQEEAKGRENVERAWIDGILNPSVVA